MRLVTRHFFVFCGVFLFALMQFVTPPPSLAASRTGMVRYTAEYGDTLSIIAQRFNVSSAVLNPTGSSSGLAPGQTVVAPLRLPRASGAGMPLGWYCTHVVRYGETIFAISRLYGVDPYQLAGANYLFDPGYIYAGQVLRVPCSGVVAPPPVPVGTAPVYYTVKPGDNLFRIAIRFGTSVYSLVMANHLPNPNLIRSGMRLYIPCPGTVQWPNVPPPPSPSPSPEPDERPVIAPTSAPAQPTPQPTLPAAAATPTLPRPTSVPAQPAATATSTATRPAATATSTSTRPATGPTASPTMNPLLNATAAPPAVQLISIENLAFNPFFVTVPLGTMVTWTNNERTNTSHTVTSGLCSGGTCTPSGEFDSKVMMPGQSFTVQFTRPGNYAYFCAIHGMSMTGVIVVQ